jgi:adenylate cyclase
MKKLLLSPWTALLTLSLVLFVRIIDPVFVESVRLRYFDTLITNKTATDNDIYTVNIDEAALDKYGQWPFPRTVYAEIIETLYKHNAGLVVWNVMMPEKDRFNSDQTLAKTLKDNPVILSNIPSAKDKNTARKPGSAVINSQFMDQIVNYPGIIANIPELEESAIGIGAVVTMPEVDGVARRMPLIIASNGRLFPGLSMEVLRVAAGDSTVQIKLAPNGVEKMRIPKFGPVTTDNLGRVWIDWSQQNKTASITELPDDLKGAIVVVGVSAAGLGNPVPTAKGSVWPQDVQAAVIATLMNGVNIQRPDYADGAETLAIFIAGIVLLLLTRWTYVGLGAVIIFAGGGVFLSQYLFDNSLWLFDATGFVAGIILVALHAYGVKFVSEYLQKQQIKKQFGTYLSPKMVEKLQENPELLKLGGDSRELSILFTDVRGFTSISEHYGKDVQGLTKIMNRYMTAMTAKIIENEGTLDKYIGDAQMAFWNAPLDDADHAKNAVRTALEMLGSLDAFNREVTAEGIPPFGMGLGINTDTVVVGNMGSSQRFDYTCLGDGVNLASRLEGQSKPYHVAMVIGPKTNEYVKTDFFTLPLDCLAVKGKKEGVDIFTVLNTEGADKPKWNQAKINHVTMMNAYKAQRFTVAKNMSKDLIGSFNGQMDHYYEMWIERCDDYIANPPGENWDGVFRTTTK